MSDIGRSEIRLSPISLITDIGLSAHLCCHIVHHQVNSNVNNITIFIIFIVLEASTISECTRTYQF
jgi:hypothetical protein